MTQPAAAEHTLWHSLMCEAIELSLSSDVFRSANPRVGCVIVDAGGTIVGRGWHRGAGTDHAEVMALKEAGQLAQGATAVVTLEPCAHTGRTGPCAAALADAGIARVVYACDDPFPPAAGGGAFLRTRGIEVLSGVLADEAEHANRAWFHVRRTGRPLVTAKMAVSLDGRVADASGGPTPITGAAARSYAHAQRQVADAIVVGTGTVLADDPHLTARAPDGELAVRQPLRVVVGCTPISPSSRVLDGAAESLVVPSRDLQEVMDALTERDVQHVILEGGPRLMAAFLEQGLVDEITWFVAPTLLGNGPVALPPLPIPVEVQVRAVSVVGEDVLVEGVIGVHRDS